MVPSAIRIVSNTICLVLVLSFGMFLVDEATSASKSQIALASQQPATAITRDAHGREINPDQTAIRTQIDRVNDQLTAPAEKLVSGGSATPSPWIQRGVPFILGLLVFGLFMNMLANWLALSRSGDSAQVGDAGFTAGYR